MGTVAKLPISELPFAVATATISAAIATASSSACWSEIR